MSNFRSAVVGRMSEDQKNSLDRILEIGEKYAPFVSPIMALLLIFYMYNLGPELRENRADLQFYIFILIWVGLASSWNIISGYTGYIDFGHTVFVGLGFYAVGVLMAQPIDLTPFHSWPLLGSLNLPDIFQPDLSFWQSLPFAFVVGAVIGGLVGWPTLRLKGPYFAIAMLGVLVAGREIIRMNKWLTNGSRGINFVREDFPPSETPLVIFHIMLAIASITFFLSWWAYRTQLGKMLQTIREDEVGADTRGINTTIMKIGALILSGGISAMIGGTMMWWTKAAEPDTAFPPDYNVQIIMMVMLGGIGRPWGPVLGAALFYTLRDTVWANLGSVHLTVTGILLIFIAMYMQGGILAFLDPENRGLDWQFQRLRIWLNPALAPKDTQIAEKVTEPEEEIPTVIDTPPHERGKLLLEGKNVVKDFGGLRAVDHVNFEIYEGEIVGLLGPNGSGKTTLFNAISGVNPATMGEILLNGEEISHRAPWQISRQRLSRTFQKIRIFDSLTVYENMLLSRQWRGVPFWLWPTVAPKAIREKADDLIEFLLLTRVKNNLASNLSGGQQRLLEIGMTLMSDPEIVLLDEATSGVNPALVEQIKANILRLNRERGVTFFLVEHNMNFAMTLCERLYVLDYGAVIAHGTPEEIQNDPAVIEAYFGRDE